MRVPRRARLVTQARGAAQALPGGDEPDFILVSCAGLGVGDGAGELGNGNGASGSGRPTTPAAMVAKRAGEAALRNCGLVQRAENLCRTFGLLTERGSPSCHMGCYDDKLTAKPCMTQQMHA